MPIFFFDVLDHRGFALDSVGIVLADGRGARREAQRALGELVRDAAPEGYEGAIVMRVRDEERRTLFMVSAVVTTTPSEEPASRA